MLPARHRMRRGSDFTTAVRRGRRAGRATLVAHLAAVPSSGAPALVGLVASKGVGSAVVRARTKRRLRHLLRDRVGRLPAGTLLVLRAQPPAVNASAQDLARDVDGVLARLLAPTGRSSSPATSPAGTANGSPT